MHACMCVWVCVWRLSDCQLYSRHAQGESRLAGWRRQREDLFHANASVLTRAAHACLFMCVKEGVRENGSVCLREGERERERARRKKEGRGDLEGFHISLRQPFTHVNTHTGTYTLPAHLIHSSFSIQFTNTFIPLLLHANRHDYAHKTLASASTSSTQTHTHLHSHANMSSSRRELDINSGSHMHLEHMIKVARTPANKVLPYSWSYMHTWGV